MQTKSRKHPNVLPGDFFDKVREGNLIGPHYEALLEIENKYERCGGEITCTIEAEEEPVFGGTYPVLEVRYRCSNCKNTAYSNLPDAYTLGEWVTEQIRMI